MVSGVADRHRYAEFFCGGGMVAAGLGSGWNCVFANDIDPLKCDAYAANWGAEALIRGDIADIGDDNLRRPLDLYWASSPCQDFSLAGHGRGLKGARSSVFSTWMARIEPLVEAGFAPRLIAFENVVGLMTRDGGRDFTAVLRAIIRLGYRVGVLEIDARHFLPQSRPRLFVVAVRSDVAAAEHASPAPSGPFHTAKVQRYHAAAPRDVRRAWLWWRHAAPLSPNIMLAGLIDADPDTTWLSQREVRRLHAMMSSPSRAKLAAARTVPGGSIGTLYKRGRPDANGGMRQRAEVRFDGIAGCLRTPAGGSSRQTLVFAEADRVRARLLSAREAIRLMGLADSYVLPDQYNAAYKIAGDGVAVPVVRWLDQTLFQPILRGAAGQVAA